MTRLPLKACKKGLLLAAGALFAVALGAPATAGYAQTSDYGLLSSRISQLENQVQTLSRSVWRGAAPPPAAQGSPVAGDTAALAGYEDRLGQLEQQQREMTGQLEEANHRAQELQARLDKLQADYDMRLQALEQGHGGTTGGAYQSSPSSYSSSSSSAPSPGTGSSAPVPPSSSGTLGEISSAGGTPDALYEKAFADIRDSRYEAAEAEFNQFMSRYPHHPLAANAQYWLAETHYVRGDYKEAARMFAQGYQDYPKGAKAPDSLLKLGLSLSKLGRKDDACLSFQQLAKEFPGDTTPANRRAAQEMKTLGCK